MDTIKTTIAMWKQFQRPGWDVKFASSQGVLIFEVPSDLDAGTLIDESTELLAASASNCQCEAAIIRFPGCGDHFYRVPSKMAQSNTGDSKSIMPKPSDLNNKLLGADYVRIHEFLVEERQKGNIVIITSNITRDESGQIISTENPAAGRDICHHTNDLLLPNRAFWDAKTFTGYNYRLSWRRDFNDYEHLNPQYHRLKEFLAADGYVSDYEYTLYRPGGSFCEYKTDFYLCRDYLGDEVRIGVSRPQDWRLISEPELQSVSA